MLMLRNHYKHSLKQSHNNILILRNRYKHQLKQMMTS